MIIDLGPTSYGIQRAKIAQKALRLVTLLRCAARLNLSDRVASFLRATGDRSAMHGVSTGGMLRLPDWSAIAPPPGPDWPAIPPPPGTDWPVIPPPGPEWSAIPPPGWLYEALREALSRVFEDGLTRASLPCHTFTLIHLSSMYSKLIAVK